MYLLKVKIWVKTRAKSADEPTPPLHKRLGFFVNFRVLLVIYCVTSVAVIVPESSTVMLNLFVLPVVEDSNIIVF